LFFLGISALQTCFGASDASKRAGCVLIALNLILPKGTDKAKGHMLPRSDDGKGSTADAPESNTQEMLEAPRNSSWIRANWRRMKPTFHSDVALFLSDP
jgi:hypothetical protein